MRIWVIIGLVGISANVVLGIALGHFSLVASTFCFTLVFANALRD